MEIAVSAAKPRLSELIAAARRGDGWSSPIAGSPSWSLSPFPSGSAAAALTSTSWRRRASGTVSSRYRRTRRGGCSPSLTIRHSAARSLACPTTTDARETMRILVDTTYLYGLMVSRQLFTASEHEFVKRHNAEIFVSAVSIWEMRLKYGSRYRSGARKNTFDPQRVLETLMDVDATFLTLTEVHAAQALEVPFPQGPVRRNTARPSPSGGPSVPHDRQAAGRSPPSHHHPLAGNMALPRSADRYGVMRSAAGGWPILHRDRGT